MDLTGFLLGFHWILLDFVGFTGFFMGLKRDLLGFIGFDWVWLGLTGFYWVWLSWIGFNLSLNKPWTGLKATECLDLVGSCPAVLSANRIGQDTRRDTTPNTYHVRFSRLRCWIKHESIKKKTNPNKIWTTKKQTNKAKPNQTPNRLKLNEKRNTRNQKELGLARRKEMRDPSVLITRQIAKRKTNRNFHENVGPSQPRNDKRVGTEWKKENQKQNPRRRGVSTINWANQPRGGEKVREKVRD